MLKKINFVLVSVILTWIQLIKRDPKKPNIIDARSWGILSHCQPLVSVTVTQWLWNLVFFKKCQRQDYHNLTPRVFHWTWDSWKLTSVARPASHWVQDPSLLTPPSAGITVACHCLHFYAGAKDPNWSPPASTVSTFLTESSPQPLHWFPPFFLCNMMLHKPECHTHTLTFLETGWASKMLTSPIWLGEIQKLLG